MKINQNLALQSLKRTLESYYPISEKTWQQFIPLCHYLELDAQQTIYRLGELPTTYSYVYQGLVRGFVTDDKANEYNKIFFNETMFPGAMTALLTNSPAQIAFETIEPCKLITINFKGFRKLLEQSEDLKLFQINYLEKNWLLAKDARETEIVQQEATERYIKFTQQSPELAGRLPQYHIASHLGITPTQLSRIRKKIAENQPM